MHFIQDGHEFLILNPTLNDEQALLQAFNGTGDGNDAYALLAVTDVLARVKINADYQDGTKNAYITGEAQVGLSTWEYSSDTHTFEGAMIFEDVAEFTDNSDAIGNGLITGAVYRTGDVLKIVH